MTTPEGKVKKQIKAVLDKYGVYYLMPVQFGLGAAGVDFHCAVGWRGLSLAFFIEAKAFGEDPTKQQRLFLERREKEQHAKTFVIDGFIGLRYLVKWLEELKASEHERERKSDDYTPIHLP